MKKSLKVGLFFAGFLMISTGCSVSYCTDADLTAIKDMYKLKTSIYVVDQVIDEVNKNKSENEKITVETENIFIDYIANKTYSDQVNSNIGSNSSEKIKNYMSSKGMDEKVNNQYYIKLHDLLTNPDTDTSNSIKDGTVVLTEYYSNAKSGLDTLTNSSTLKNNSTCLTTDKDVKEPVSGAVIEPKTWKFAWQKGPLQGLITYPISLLKSMPVFGEATDKLKNFCDKMMLEEEQYVVLKKNSGAMQENIKFPMDYHKMLNGLLLNQINITPGTLLRVHANSCVNPDIVEDSEEE